MYFLRHLYSLCEGLDQTDSAVSELNVRIDSQPMKSMYTRESTGNGTNGYRGRKRTLNVIVAMQAKGTEMTTRNSVHVAMW